MYISSLFSELSPIFLNSRLSSFFGNLIMYAQVFMLRRASEEPRGHPAAIMAEVLLEAECKGIINASQKKVLLQEMALQLS